MDQHYQQQQYSFLSGEQGAKNGDGDGSVASAPPCFAADTFSLAAAASLARRTNDAATGDCGYSDSASAPVPHPPHLSRAS
eukprot:8256969-Ditylum_brightwellii.AAC.1